MSQPKQVPQRLAAAFVALAGLVAACPTAALAGASTTPLSVSVTVMERTSLEIHSAPASIRVTASDVDRGFLDVDQPVSLSVISNSPNGAMITLLFQSDYIERASASGLDAPVMLGRAGGVVTLPHKGIGRQRTAALVRFRLYLAKATPIGVHPWPVQIAAGAM